MTGLPGLQAFTLDSASTSPLPASPRCVVELVSLLGLGVIPAASLFWVLGEHKSLLSITSSMDT